MLQVVHSTTGLILSIVVQDRVSVGSPECPLNLWGHDHASAWNLLYRNTSAVPDTDLMAKDKSRDPGHELSEEDQRQKHGVLQEEEKKVDLALNGCVLTHTPSHSLSPASASMGFLCRWRSIRTARTR